MDKKRGLLFLLIVLISGTLAGCSSPKEPTTTTATKTPTGELADSNPLIPNSSLKWDQIRDPILYEYMSKTQSNQSGGIIPTTTSTLSPEESKKIGLVGRFNKSSKYKLSGTAQIISQSKIQLKAFNYNGLCGELTLALTRSNDLQRRLVDTKTIPTGIADGTFYIEIPPNLKLIQFDSIGAYCTNNADPISIATFSS